ncbi:MAG: serine/threonine-protein kinase, partial [Kofleriaceae bacterium]
MDSVAIGDYTLIARLGRGGMAEVFLAVRGGLVGFTKLIVIKRLRADLADQPDAPRYRRLLLDEARLAARLRHPHIVQTFEVGEQAGAPFMAMEYLDGQSLSRVLARALRAGIEIPAWLSLRVVGDMLSALDYAHELADFDGTPLAIVHRDVSPQNVFWTYDGEIKLVDFGVAKFALGQDETEAGVLKGKIGYMAPEQAQGGPIDRRADVFAAGIVLWELIAGRRLLRGKSHAETLQRLLFSELPSLAAVRPGTDPAIVRICERALHRDPAHRYPTAAAMRHDVERALGDRAVRRTDLAAFIAPLFEAERQDVAEQIRVALSGTAHQSLISLAVETSSSIAQPELGSALATVPGRPPAPTAPGTETVARRPAWLIRGLVGALAIVLVAIAVVVAVPGRDHAADRGGSGAPATAIRAPEPAAAAPPSPAAAPAPILRLCGSNT